MRHLRTIPEVLDQYCNFMEEYLNQGILEAQMEKEQRVRYIRLLNQKLKIKATLHTCVCLFKNLMKNGDYVQAGEILELMDQKWHHREEFWTLKIQYLAEHKMASELQKCLRQMQEEHIYLSSKSKGIGFLVRLKSLKTFPFKSMLVILCVFMMMAVVLFAERSGIQYTEKNRKVAYLDREEVVTEQTAVKSLPKTCLVLRNSADEASEQAWTQFQQIFKDMKVGTDVVDLQSDSVIPDYDEYETVVVLLSDISPLKEKLLELCDWVSEGGNALFAMTLQKTAYTSIIEQKLGIISSGYENTVVDSIYFEPDFMLGGGQAYEITDPYDSAWSVQLSEQAKVHAQVEDENGQPVIWENQYGKGKFVVDNFGLYEKAVRGFYAASYSLLTDVGIYPVINGSTFLSG